MSLLDLRTAITAKLDAALPNIDVKSHGGRFTLQDLQRIATQAPAVRVGCLGVIKAELSGSSVTVTATWGAFALAKDKHQLPRDAGALIMAAQILSIIPENNWGIDDAGLPDKIRGDNVYSGKLDAKGVALWAVTWTQSTEIETLDFESLHDFATFAADYDLDPADGETDASDSVPLDQ